MTLINPLGASTGAETASPESALSAAEWNRDAAQRALDELFQFARQYTSSEEFRDLMCFTARFRMYSPFNALLAYIQMPGASYVAPRTGGRGTIGAGSGPVHGPSCSSSQGGR